jgi:hypothetical protein
MARNDNAALGRCAFNTNNFNRPFVRVAVTPLASTRSEPYKKTWRKSSLQGARTSYVGMVNPERSRSYRGPDAWRKSSAYENVRVGEGHARRTRAGAGDRAGNLRRARDYRP